METRGKTIRELIHEGFFGESAAYTQLIGRRVVSNGTTFIAAGAVGEIIFVDRDGELWVDFEGSGYGSLDGDAVFCMGTENFTLLDERQGDGIKPTTSC